MKTNFWNTKMQEMTVLQGFVWIMLYMIFLVIVMIAMVLVPQNAEAIWDWIEARYEKVKEKILNCRIFKKK